jgi:hypothetical protein
MAMDMQQVSQMAGLMQEGSARSSVQAYREQGMPSVQLRYSLSNGSVSPAIVSTDKPALYIPTISPCEVSLSSDNVTLMDTIKVDCVMSSGNFSASHWLSFAGV